MKKYKKQTKLDNCGPTLLYNISIWQGNRTTIPDCEVKCRYMRGIGSFLEDIELAIFCNPYLKINKIPRKIKYIDEELNKGNIIILNSKKCPGFTGMHIFMIEKSMNGLYRVVNYSNKHDSVAYNIPRIELIDVMKSPSKNNMLTCLSLRNKLKCLT